MPPQTQHTVYKFHSSLEKKRLTANSTLTNFKQAQLHKKIASNKRRKGNQSVGQIAYPKDSMLSDYGVVSGAGQESLKHEAYADSETINTVDPVAISHRFATNFEKNRLTESALDQPRILSKGGGSGYQTLPVIGDLDDSNMPRFASLQTESFQPIRTTQEDLIVGTDRSVMQHYLQSEQTPVSRGDEHADARECYMSKTASISGLNTANNNQDSNSGNATVLAAQKNLKSLQKKLLK